MILEHGNPLLNDLNRAIVNKQSILVTLPSGGHLLVMGKERLYRQKNCHLAELTDAQITNSNVQIIPTESNVLDSVRAKGREIEELLWMMGFSLSNGELIGEMTPLDIIALKRWPNFTRLPHTNAALTMTATLSNRPMSVHMLSRVLNLPTTEVNQFCSALLTSGYAYLNNKIETATQLKPHKEPKLIHSLLSKLKRTA